MSPLSLPDRAHLEEVHPDHTVWQEGRHICVAIPAFPLGSGLQPDASDLLIRLPSGYPERRPDMFWFADSIVRTDGGMIPAINVVQDFGGRRWHRWSRHMVASEWRSSDGIRGYLGYVRLCLRDAAKQAA